MNFYQKKFEKVYYCEEKEMNNSFWRWRRPTAVDSANTARPQSPAMVTGSSAEALCSIFGDDEVSDVRLEGYDGGTVVAVKAILASRSPMFRHKFFGEETKIFVPTKHGEKEVFKFKDWDCRVLHLVVEYCYTDSCSAMRGQPTEDIARLLATLRVASKVFKLPGLLDKIKQWSWRQINRHPAIACAMVDEGMRNDDVDELALQTLQLKSRAALLPGQNTVGSGVLALSKPGLLFVLRTLEETTSHYLLLQVIERWVDFSSDGCSGNNANRERASRQAFARKCAMRFIKLSKIPQENFDVVMKRSSFFETKNGIPPSLLQSDFQFSDSTSNSSLNVRKPMMRPTSSIGGRAVSPISTTSSMTTRSSSYSMNSSPTSSSALNNRTRSMSPTIEETWRLGGQ